MAKPLNENLKAVRIETEDGDLLPIMDVAGAKLARKAEEGRITLRHPGYVVKAGL